MRHERRQRPYLGRRCAFSAPAQCLPNSSLAEHLPPCCAHVHGRAYVQPPYLISRGSWATGSEVPVEGISASHFPRAVIASGRDVSGHVIGRRGEDFPVMGLSPRA